VVATLVVEPRTAIELLRLTATPGRLGGRERSFKLPALPGRPQP